MKLPIVPLITELKGKPFTLMWLFGLTVAIAYGYTHYATAGNVSALKTTIEGKMSTLESKVNANGAKIDRVLRLQVSTSIRSQHSQICRTANEVAKMTLRQTLDSLQADYMDITGEFYPLGACNES